MSKNWRLKQKKRAREQVVRVFQADREFEVDVGPKQLQWRRTSWPERRMKGMVRQRAQLAHASRIFSVLVDKPSESKQSWTNKKYLMTRMGKKNSLEDVGKSVAPYFFVN